MAKSRVVEYTLKLVEDPSNAATAAAFGNRFKTGGGVSGTPGGVAAAAAGNRGGFNAGYRQASAAARRQEQRNEIREIEANLRESLAAQRKADREKLAAEKAANRERIAAAKAAAREQAAARKQAEREIAAAAKASGLPAGGGFNAGYDKGSRTEAKRLAAEERRENEANIRANAAAQKQAARDVVAAKKAAAREEASLDRQLGRQVGTLGKQYGQRERLGKQADMATTKAWKDAGQAVGAATGAMVAYGRAVVLASAADEESAQRMLQKIARFEAFASVLTGTVALVKAGTSAWKAYQAAAAAAALAQGAGGAARAGMGSQIAGIAGRAGKAGLIAGGIGLAAGAGMVGLSAIGGIAQGKGVRESLGKAARDIWEGVTEFLGISDRAASAAKEAKERAAQARQYLEDADARFGIREGGEREMIALNRERGMLGPGSDEAKLRAALKGTRNEISFKESQQSGLGNNVGIGTRQAMADSMVMLRRQELSDVKEIARIELDAKRAKIDGERQALGVLKDRAQEARRMLQEAQNASKDAATRFGDLSGSEQQATLAAVRKAKAGGDLNVRERELLRNNVGGAATTVADEASRRAAKKAGFGEAQEFGYRPLIQKAQAGINTLNAKVDAKNEITIKMEADYKRTAEATAKAMQPVFDKLTEAIAESMELMVRKLESDIELRNATAGG